jgi:uncharacterized protein (TIGR03435 family)
MRRVATAMSGFAGVFMGVFTSMAAAQQFEVASVRARTAELDDWQKIGVHIDGAMVRCTALALTDYIAMAYRVKNNQVSGPDWINGSKFDITAKIPEGAARTQVPEMMRALLEERFALKLHRETKELPVYAITLGKGPLKLKESVPDPQAPAPPQNVDVTVSEAKKGQGADIDLGGGSSISSTGGKIEGRRVTITQLISSMERFLDRPVVDMTGLTGRYDLTLQCSLEEVRNVLRSTGSAVRIPDAAADQFPGSIADSLQAAGLKLEARKGPIEVLVIDHAERTPTGN